MATFPTCCGRQEALKPETEDGTAPQHEHILLSTGKKALWDARAASKHSNSFTTEHPRLGNEVFPPGPASECPSCSGSPEQPRNAAAAFEERHVRPWQPLLRGSIWLQLPTLECRAAIFGAEGSGGEQTGHYLHIKGRYSPRHHRKAA